jgi:hypothetical protein
MPFQNKVAIFSIHLTLAEWNPKPKLSITVAIFLFIDDHTARSAGRKVTVDTFSLDALDDKDPLVKCPSHWIILPVLNRALIINSYWERRSCVVLMPSATGGRKREAGGHGYQALWL